MIRTIALALLLAAPAAGQEPPRAATITIQAEGRIERAPDYAGFSGGVVTVAPTAAAALADNARRMTAVIAAVRSAGVADRDIQTARAGVQPQYRYEANRSPALTGYRASNTVALRLRRIPEAGKLLDTLVAAGANQIAGPNFGIEAVDAARDEARSAAVATARQRAELYAKAAGLRIKRVSSIVEGGIDPIIASSNFVAAAQMREDAPSTPIEPGEVIVTVQVTIVFEVE